MDTPRHRAPGSLEVAQAIAAHDEHLASLFTERSASAGTTFEAPALSDSAVLLNPAGGTETLRWTLLHAGAVARSGTPQRAVYANVFEGADRIVVGGADFLEDALLFHKSPARAAASWRLVVPKDLTVLERSGSLHIERGGRQIAGVPRPYALDAAGRRRDLPLRWDAARSELTVDLRLDGLSFPVLLDPEIRIWSWSELPFITGRIDPAAAYLENPANPKGKAGVFAVGGYSSNSRYSSTIRWDSTLRTWSRVDDPAKPAPDLRYATRMAPDGDGHLILTGGSKDSVSTGDGLFDDTWSWDGFEWTKLDVVFENQSGDPNKSPFARAGMALAYSPDLRQVVLVGGYGGTYPNDLWLGRWETKDHKRWIWSQRTPSQGAGRPYVQLAGMASMGGRVWLYGGFFGGSYQRSLLSWGRVDNDPWSFHGCVTEGGDPISGCQLAYPKDPNDPNDDSKKVWAGGVGGPQYAYRSTLTHMPAAPGRPEMLLTFGGVPNDDGLWGWDGTKWTEFDNDTVQDSDACTSVEPREDKKHCLLGRCVNKKCTISGRDGHAQVWDKQADELVILGGSDSYGITYPDTWTWKPSSGWRKAVGSVPPPRDAHALAANQTPIEAVPGAARREILLFGGSSPLGAAVLCEIADTWTLTRSGTADVWTRQQVGPSNPNPSGRTGAALVFDPTENAFLMFGGECNGRDSKTWLWNGSWVEANAQGPSGRRGHAMAYDDVRRQMVLFGGSGDGGDSDETWVRPSRTSPQGPAPQWALLPRQAGQDHPGPRAGHALASGPPGSGQILLFGGTQGGRLQNDTWLWDGTRWNNWSKDTRPPPRTGHSLYFDQKAGRYVLVGGLTDRGAVATSIWQLDPQTKLWSIGTVLGEVSARGSSPVVYDPLRAAAIRFGGGDEHDTVQLVPVGVDCLLGCPSGQFCVDAVCCNVPKCDGTCQTCNGETPGECSPLRGRDDNESDGSCKPSEGKTCTDKGECKVVLGRDPGDGGAPSCASGFVVDGRCCATESCEACQTCKAEDQQSDPDAGARPAGACGRVKASLKPECAACRADTDCLAPNKCDFDGVCKPLLPLDVPTGCAQGAALPSPGSLAPVALALLLLRRRRRQCASVATSR